MSNGAGSAAAGTRLLLAKAGGLAFEEEPEGALVEAGGGGLGDLLHEIQIDIEIRAVVAEGAAGDDLAPAGGEVA